MNRLTTWTLALLLVWAAGRQFVDALGWGHDSWQLTEWLINYQGGFVRRGLPGEVFHFLADRTGIPANQLVLLFSFGVFAAFASVLIHLARGSFAIPFLVSSVVLGFSAYQDCIVRKDCLLLLGFFLCVRLLKKGLSTWLAEAGVAVVSCLAVLCHETYAFFAFPGLLLYHQHAHDVFPWRKTARRLLLLTPALACFALAVVFHGTPETARAVNTSWIPLWEITNPGDPLISEPAAAIQALSWSKEKGLSLGVTLLTSGFYQPAAWLMVFGVSSVLALAFLRGRNDEHLNDLNPQAALAATLAIQFFAISPLFLLGYDYGRWLFDWITSSIILHSAGFLPPAPVLKMFSKWSEALRIRWMTEQIGRKGWILLLFGVPVCWNIREFLHASPVGRIVEMIRSSI